MRRFFNAGLRELAAIAEQNDLQMAVPADKKIKLFALPENEIEQLRTQVNNLTATVRLISTYLDVLGAKLNADAGVTDVNYVVTNAANQTDAAIATAPVTLLVL